jgi:hypothetical protein
VKIKCEKILLPYLLVGVFAKTFFSFTLKRERQRETERDRERQRETERDRQTDRDRESE